MTTFSLKISNGETINYFQHGHHQINKKPTLFFIHGHFGCWKWWLDTIEIFKKWDYHIIAVDMRGFGDSSYINKCSHFKDWASDLVEFSQIKKIEKLIAIGWSFGGGISMKFAELAPAIVQKVVLTCSISYNGYICILEGIACKTMQQLEQHPGLKFMQGGIIKSDRQAISAQIYSSLLIPNQPQLLNKCQRMIDGTLKQRCYFDVWYAMANSDIDISAIKAKGLFFHGVKDTIIQLEDVKSTGQFFKNFQIWQNNAHMIPIESPQKYADTVRNFIQKEN